MKKHSLFAAMAALVLGCLLSTWHVHGAEPKAVRLAIGPFFAALDNKSLHQSGEALPELMAAKLSAESRFELVEREKVQTVWNEVHLNASGLAGQEGVLRLGRMLACDWVLSGSLVSTPKEIQLWTKIIDVKSSLVLDLDSFRFATNDLSAMTESVTQFVRRAGTRSQARQFAALGQITDMNPNTSGGREDWTRRLRLAIEKNLHAAGYGVVELEAVRPIFEERQLESAGMTGQAEKRVLLQSACWVIDGGCEYPDSSERLTVALRVQQIGAQEQMLELGTVAIAEVEVKIGEEIGKALLKTNANVLSAAEAAKAESELQTARGMELATRRSPFALRSKTVIQQQPGTRTIIRDASGRVVSSSAGNAQQWQAQLKEREENRQKALATYERTILLDPKNLEAKFMLGYALLADRDAAQRERGKQLLQEVKGSGDPKWSERAEKILARADELAARVERDARRAAGQ